MSALRSPDLPRWAHVPGTTAGADHARLKAAAALWTNAAPGDARFAAGLDYGLALLGQSFFWEAHEVLEPLWNALAPNSRERATLRAIIQLANAGLKLRMARPKAALRLLDEAQATLAPLGAVCLGIDIPTLRERVAAGRDRLRDGQPHDWEALWRSCIKMPKTG